MSEEQGGSIMRKIGDQWPLRAVNDPVSEYVQKTGRRLARGVDPHSRQPWDFYVLRNAEPSAFAVGGGHFVISDGLIAFVRSESELAAVLAHEISHQSLGHFCRGVSSAAERIDRGTVVQHYDLEAEMDADREAVDLLTVAGFDPRAMESALHCLQGLSSPSGPHLSKRAQSLGTIGVPDEGRGDVQSNAFEEVRALVEQDLGDSAHQDCHWHGAFDR